MARIFRNNPWLGLESYREGEVLYGRDDDIRDLSQCVLNNNETLLYGKSGIGKSSILNAGIIPAARYSGFLPIIIRLSHKEHYPYLSQIKDAIANAFFPPFTDESGNPIVLTQSENDSRIEALKDRIREVVKCNNSETESLYEYFHRHTFHDEYGNRIKLLMIFDQFEEMFTLQTDESEKKRFFSELADLLNDIMPSELQPNSIFNKDEDASAEIFNEQEADNLFDDLSLLPDQELPEYVTDNEIHLVLTIREDFLSEFEYYSAAIPSLKHNRYGLRPLNEEQAAQIILRPVPGLISEEVARLIIEKVTGRKDFKLDGIPEIEVDSAVLSLYLNRLYDAKTGDTITAELIESKGSEIIKDFYWDAISGISRSTIEFLEDMLLNGNGRRDNITAYDAIHDGGATEQELDILCNKKKILRQFNYAGDLRIEYVHDILCSVVKAHKDERLLLKQQEEERLRQEEEKQRLQAEAEKKQREIEEKAAKEKAELEAEAEISRIRNKRRVSALMGILIFVSLVMGITYISFFADYSEFYGNYTTKDGWPIGLGEELTSQREKEICTIHYKLTRQGWLSSISVFGWKFNNPFIKVEILNWDGKPTTNVFMKSPAVSMIDKELDNEYAAMFAKMLARIAYWRFIADVNGNMSSKIAYDINNKELFSEVFSKESNNISNNRKTVLWCQFKDKDGNQLWINDNGMDRIRYTVFDGIITSCSFFSEMGTTQPNTSSCFGYSYKIDSISHQVVSQAQLDKYGDEIPNSRVDFGDFKYGRYTKFSSGKVLFSKQRVFFCHRNYTDTIQISQSGIVSKVSLNVNRNNITKILINYNPDGNLVNKQKYSHDDIIYNACHYYSNVLDSIRIFDKYSIPQCYTVRYSYSKKNGDITEVSYWDNQKAIERVMNESGEKIIYHKKQIKETKRNNKTITTTSYFNKDNKLTVNGSYSKSIIVEDEHKNILYKYYYDYVDEIRKSEMFTYNDYGIRESRSVAGIFGTPVRCPNWDENGFAYYKMKFSTNNYLDDGYSMIKGVDELGMEIPIVNNDREVLSYEEVSPSMIQELTESFVYRGVAINKVSLSRMTNLNSVPYIHLLNKKGSIYNATPQITNANIKIKKIVDGDIVASINGIDVINNYQPQQVLLDKLFAGVIKNGGQMSILRYERGQLLEIFFNINKGYMGAEYHICPVSDKMCNKINNVLK